jgi:Fe-S-cluster containining protein
MDMNRIAQLAYEVRLLFDELDAVLFEFSRAINIACPHACIECCMNPVVQATVLEFLPLALRLYEDGSAEEVYVRLADQASGCETSSGCVFASASGCLVYQDRGLICRLFSASVRLDRQGRSEFVACSILHARHGRYLEAGLLAPVITDWGHRLEAIDYGLGGHWYPLREAMRKALELVLYSNHLGRAG